VQLKKHKTSNVLDELLEENEEHIDLELVEHKDLKAWTRPGTSDSFVCREVSSGEYRRLKITPDDVIVDFGLNIGMFTSFALKKGAKRVHSYEAEAENFELAKMNVSLNGVDDRAVLNNLAVVGNDDEERYFAINLKKNKGAHSLIHKRGRDTVTVKCVNINKVIEEVNPSIVKMDIEGGEYEALTALKNYDNIQQLIFEFHHAHLNDIPHHTKYNEILDLMRSKFPNVEAREETKGAWVNIVYCWR
jgi:FkbM family methyltransferase